MYKRICYRASASVAHQPPKQIKMKSIILVVLAFAAVAIAAPPSDFPQIVRSSFDPKPDGSYNFGFETENGISRNEDGQVKEVLDADNKLQPVVVVRGSYSYTNVDGKPETVNYFADETGYHAEGDSIPKPARR